MSLMLKKAKPSLMGRLFNKDRPQPSSLASRSEKTLDADGEVLDVRPSGTRSTGLFSSRRSKSMVSSQGISDVDTVELHIPKTDDSHGNTRMLEPESVEPAEATPTAPAPAAEPRGLFGSKARKKGDVLANDSQKFEPPSSTEQGETAESIPKQPLSKGFFGKIFSKGTESPLKETSKRSSPKEPKKPRESKEPRSKNSTKAKGGRISSLVLLTELGENGKQLLWEVGASTLAQVQATTVPSEVISFSKEDIRFHVDASMSYAKAHDKALEELGEMVAVVNLSKGLNAIYCTREERAMSSPYRIAPGQQSLDILLKKNGLNGQALVTGFSLKSEDGQTSVVVLYSVSKEGESSKPQVTVNPDNMEFVLSQFTSSRKINRKETAVVLYSNEDLLSIAGEIKFFSDEPVWNGVPVRVLQSAGAVVTGVVAAGVVAWAGQGLAQKQSLTAQKTKIEASIKEISDKNSRIIEGSLGSFSRHMSQDQTYMFSLAQQVWVPSSKVTVEMKGDSTNLSVTLPLSTEKKSGATSLNGTTNPGLVKQLYEKEAPEGCSKSQPQTTGTLNELRIDFTCQNLDSPLRRYRSD